MPVNTLVPRKGRYVVYICTIRMLFTPVRMLFTPVHETLYRQTQEEA